MHINITYVSKSSELPSCTAYFNLYLYIFLNIINCAGQRLITINGIQNKRFWVHDTCECTVYIYYDT